MKIAIIGGTGVYDSSILDEASEITVDTKYGHISLIKGTRNKNEVFFLQRHGKNHKLIPSKVNYKGNIMALKNLGVDLIISTAAVGGINHCSPLDFVILDQFIDFTKNRSASFFDEENSGVLHVDMTEPYCKNVRKQLINSFKNVDVTPIEKGTYVCTEGPRFETPAEIQMYKILGGDVVGMTNVPEVVLAREASICYATIALVTNYASGISENQLTHKEVGENMLKMSKTLKMALEDFLDTISYDYTKCSCRNSQREINSLK
ncbi:S-methyl-5'-thioadenosine phosphorylase [Haloimpatiens sp. FM7315]|uniref:S-methyl-5'-thioadenosine phosphorylase n=1 Tax=Haloimpatiens sp. FM7315 TaxID=3298609 RepID=UPI0039779E24